MESTNLSLLLKQPLEPVTYNIVGTYFTYVSCEYTVSTKDKKNRSCISSFLSTLITSSDMKLWGAVRNPQDVITQSGHVQKRNAKKVTQGVSNLTIDAIANYDHLFSLI
jgi:hypothetical protein